MLSKLVIKLYSMFLELALWLLLLTGVIGGAAGAGPVGAIMGFIFAAIMGPVIFGAFLVLDDIRKRLVTIEEKSKTP